LDACRDVFQTEIPHYFRDLFTDRQSVAPRVYNASRLDTPDPRCVVSIIGCTGDWFGGWDGLEQGDADLLITEDLGRGRMVDVIAREEPAVIVCHWPGIYCGGTKRGFAQFQQVVRRLHARYDNLLWMKLSELSRYWAAKELTGWKRTPRGVSLSGPFACPGFTVATSAPEGVVPTFGPGDAKSARPLRRVDGPLRLASGTWTRTGDELIACVDLPRGDSTLAW
jgi:hypothetical protein